MSEYKVLVVPELGCAYRLEEGEIEYCPMFGDGNLETSNWSPVEEGLVGEEIVTFRGMEVTLSQVFRAVENKLKEEK